MKSTAASRAKPRAALPVQPYVHVQPWRVIYGDTDQMGVAYYANYLRWFEVGRNEYLRAVGYPYTRIESDGIVLPVVEVGCRYLRPAYYDDLLHIESQVEELGRVRVRFAYRIARAATHETLATGFTVHGSLDRQGSPSRLPASFLAVLKDFERTHRP
jgi:acyl-CoA thioester hydrolase